MTAAPLSGTSAAAHAFQGELNAFDVLILLVKRKTILIGIPLLIAALAVAATYVWPRSYRASATLLPPQQSQSGTAAVLAQLGGIAAAVAGAGAKSTGEVYVSMLRSRTVADRMIARHDLARVYGTDSPDMTRLALERNTLIAERKDGLLSIAADDRDPNRAAMLANAYVDELARLTRTLATTEAAQRRSFFEKQLAAARDKLTRAELTLKDILGTHGIASVDAQSQAMVQTAARLRAMVSAKEIELDAMRAFVTASNPEYHRVQQELVSVKHQLSALENGRGGLTGTAAEGGGLKSIQALRDLKYYQMLYELLAKQYETARLGEAREASVVQVLDPAIAPETPVWPKRGLTGAIAFVVALLATLGGVFLSEANRINLADPIRSAKRSQLRHLLTHW